MLTDRSQPGILAPLPPLSRYLSFRLDPEVDPRAALRRLTEHVDGTCAVLGLGPAVLSRVEIEVEGMHDVPSFEGSLEPIPRTPHALWVWLRGEDRGNLLHLSRHVVKAAEQAFALESITDGFFHANGRDLTGYEDGTENPRGPKAVQAGLSEEGGAGIAGGSFVAVQKWQHDLTRFESFQPAEQDAMVGRRRVDNIELSDAPRSSHVSRTDQGSFEPKAFMLRRSMPWVHGERSGLMFVAFARSFYAFEAQLRRMVGLEDGIVDALFRFSRPLTTSYYWCPPARNGSLDLRALG